MFVGYSQIKKVNGFIEKRKENFIKIKDKLKRFEKYFILPEAQENSEPSWFGFLISVREDAPFNRNDIVKYLNDKKIHVSNRSLKDGILLSGCSPYYDDLRRKSIEIHSKFCSVASDFRRFGSAVLEICSIASGRAEVYFELKLMPWDYAAASLILDEAGGKISTIHGDALQYNNPTSVLASNGVEDYLKYIN